MININLLSPTQKSELKTKRIYIAIKELVMLILLFTIIMAIMLLTSRYYLEIQLADLIEQNAVSINIGQQTSQKIKDINQKINSALDIQAKFKKWSMFMTELSNITPDNISYSFVKVYHQAGTLELQGTSATRQDLIRLQGALENSDLLTEVNVPINNLLAKEKNNFSIQ